MTKVFLDACVLNRLSDDPSQSRIRNEAEAAERIFRSIFLGELQWSASAALEREVERNPDRDKRNDALALLSYAGPLAEPDDAVVERAEFLREAGYGTYDALHLAYAEGDRAEVLLTTDDRFIRQAARGLGKPLVRVLNPVDWWKEVRDGSVGDSGTGR